MMDPDRDERDKRCAALAGVPQQVSADLCFSMWIPARDLTSLEHLRDFKAIPRAGISFVCTDREVCTKLGGEAVTICGCKFTVQAYSKYSHWYYVDLQRLPDDVSDGTIYDWFAGQGTPPVFITPAHIVGGLRSRSRRVYFAQKTAPASVMIDKRTPLRQIQFLGQGYSVVHHRRREYNRVIPPFIKELRAKHRKPAEPQPDPPSPDADDTASTPPAFDDQSDTSENAAMADASDSDFEPHSGDESESDSSQSGSMDGIEVAIEVRRKAIWPSGNPPPKFPVAPTKSSDFAPDRVLRAKRLIFGEAANPAKEWRSLPPSQKDYPVVSTVNSYEWLATGEGGSIPPDQDIILWDRSQTPASSVGSYVAKDLTAETAHNSVVYQGSVEELSLKNLCLVIKEVLGSFESNPDPDTAISSVQAQPSLHRAFGHAVLRELATRPFEPEGDTTVYGRLSSQLPDLVTTDLQEALGLFYPDEAQFWLKVKLAEFDLALQIIAPSIYLDPFKMGAFLGKAASALPHPLWLLWDDSTLASIIMSPLLDRILTGPLPADLRETIEYLRNQATSVPPSSVPTHL
ncbi:hypothetical protein PHYSODRAFT_320278 [Phytophthora sojae]|uniref:Uncharacterized protein n=1 Tax=Phytophthora sojae (strain P6497) TaxID=1094619 RepID=G5AHX8_PHYSP|nr:hypothetical protein PHYSODRAFT_320278 [Phytophthora sojae]EGZ04874.1 hypothetical protein PHYSODRAFT_320278 [Phytophthora sojae]|eukprot:XP_009539716.1 hypothetical protein PHYSODRAFT_320278 [Phytophthora sojae]